MKSKWKLVLPIAAVLLLVSLLAPAVALAQTTTATRDIADQTLAPGDTTQVTVTIDVAEAEALALDENPPAGWTLTRVSEDPAASAYNANTNEWVWFQAAVGTITVVYNLTVPGGAASNVYPLTGTILGEGWTEAVNGENEITVSGAPPVATTATRDIADQTLAPGATTQVTVAIDVAEAEALALDENPPAGWTLTRVSEAPAASAYNANTNEWVWFQAAVGTITVVYNLTVPGGAASNVYPLTGTIEGVGWSEDVDGENTITVSGAVVPFSLTTTLLDGWSLLSTPVLLDANSNSLGQIFDAQSLSNIDIFYSWNGENFVEVFDDYELLPLDAICVNVMSDASAVAEFFPSQALSGLPSRGLQEGLNLFGPAPALESVPQAMPLDQALASIAQAPGGIGGYTMVISPAYNQTGWTYALGGGVRDLLPYEGYWVVMDNADTLYGFSTTPISE